MADERVLWILHHAFPSAGVFSSLLKAEGVDVQTAFEFGILNFNVRVQTLKILVELGANVEVPNVLRTMVSFDDTDRIQFLLDNKIEVNPVLIYNVRSLVNMQLLLPYFKCLPTIGLYSGRTHFRGGLINKHLHLQVQALLMKEIKGRLMLALLSVRQQDIPIARLPKDLLICLLKFLFNYLSIVTSSTRKRYPEDRILPN